MSLKNVEETFVRQPDIQDEIEKENVLWVKALDKLILFDDANISKVQFSAKTQNRQRTSKVVEST